MSRPVFKFIHAADVHLDSPLSGLEQYEGAPTDVLRAATRGALENLVTLALDEEVAFVLIVGDLFDGDWKDYNTGLFLASQLARLKERSISVFIVSGNHDAASQISRHLSLPDNVSSFPTKKPQTFQVEGLDVVIHGQGYPTRAITTDLSESYPDAQPGAFNIGMLHTSMTGRQGHEPYAPCTVEGLASKGYDYWALGHVHKREVVLRDPWIVFPGNIQGRHARETGPKGCSLITVEDESVVSVDHHDLDVVRWVCCEVDVTGQETGYDVVERVRAALEEELDQLGEHVLAARVVLTGATNANIQLRKAVDYWTNEIRAAAIDLAAETIWIEKTKVLTRGVLASDICKDSALGGLMRAVQDLQEDDAGLADLSKLFDDLRRKLPGEVATGEGGLDLQDPKTFRELLADVGSLLLANLSDEPEVP